MGMGRRGGLDGDGEKGKSYSMRGAKGFRVKETCWTID